MQLEKVDKLPYKEDEALLLEFIAEGNRYARVIDGKRGHFRLAKDLKELIQRDDIPYEIKHIRVDHLNNNVYLTHL